MACIVQSIQVNCIMRLISIFILSLSLRGSKGFSVDYVVNKLKFIQGLFGPLSQTGGKYVMMHYKFTSFIRHLYLLQQPRLIRFMAMCIDQRGKLFLEAAPLA